MPLYEHVFIARQDVSSTQVDQLVEDFTGVVESGGGKVVETELWGLRNLSYRIKKNRKGHYVMMNLDTTSEVVNELERLQRIHDDVLRYLTLRVDEHEEGPSIMMQGRKDRGPRSDEESDRPASTTTSADAPAASAEASTETAAAPEAAPTAAAAAPEAAPASETPSEEESK